MPEKDPNVIRGHSLGSLFVRNVRAMGQLEIFLVSAVTTILLIRLFLELTNYPQLGNSSLHIAHMLWGGLGMLVAALVRLMFLGRWVEYFSAFIGGVGFGAFIDEIGKFVTQDNDYFFAPSFSLMYVIFVIIYLAAHWALTRTGYRKTEYLMNSVNFLQDYSRGFLVEDRRQEMTIMLGQADADDPLVKALNRLLPSLPTRPAVKPGPYQRAKRWFENLYVRVVKSKLFAPLLNAFFIMQLLVGVTYILGEVFYPHGLDASPEEPSFSDYSLLISSTISALCVFVGVLFLHRSRLTAYKWFERSMLVNILLSQVFLFTINQLGAISGLFFSLLVLGALRLLISQEREQLSR